MRFYAMYRPLRVFMSIGALLGGIGLLMVLRFLYFYLLGEGVGHVQSLILAAILIIVGLQTCLIGLLADLVQMNRKMIEEALYRVRDMESRHRDG